MERKIFFAGVTIILIFAFRFFTTHNSQLPPKNENLREYREYWNEKIHKLGAEQLYEEFITEFTIKPFDKQHAFIHVFGEILYENLNIEGFSICDESFAFGCYHGFIGQAVANEGTSIVSTLNSECLSRFGNNNTGCQHGIGHGLLEYLGPNRLVEALYECKKTHQPDPLQGCTAGVFMEHNTSNSIDPITKQSTSIMREPDALNPAAPCNTIVPKEFRASCYHEISLWWKNAMGMNYEAMGRLCGEAGGEEEKKACYIGLGNVIASNQNYETKSIIDSCKKMPETVGTHTCLRGALSRLQGTGNNKQEAQEICNIIPMPLKEHCDTP